MYEHVPLGLTPGSGNAGGVSSMVSSEVHSELFRKRSQAISLLAACLHSLISSQASRNEKGRRLERRWRCTEKVLRTGT